MMIICRNQLLPNWNRANWPQLVILENQDRVCVVPNVIGSGPLAYPLRISAIISTNNLELYYFNLFFSILVLRIGHRDGQSNK